MVLEYKTPMARKAAWSYCRRCLAVMLCCVLVFGLTVRVTPRAKAVAVVDDAAILGLSIAGAGLIGSFAQNPVAGSIGQYAMAGSGYDITIGVVGGHDDPNVPSSWGNTLYYDPWSQEIGAQLMAYLIDTTGSVGDWAISTVAAFEAKGGLAAGDSFEIPADVQAAIRVWASDNLAFDGGIVQFDDAFLYGTDGAFVLTDVNWTKKPTSGDGYGSAISVGSVVPAPVFSPTADLSQPYVQRFDIMEDFYFELNWTPSGDGVSSWRGDYVCKLYFHSAHLTLGGGYRSGDSWESVRDGVNEAISEQALCALNYVASEHLYYLGAYRFSNNRFASNKTGVYNALNYAAPASVATTIVAPPQTDDPPAAPVTVHVPTGVASVDVGGYTVPLTDVVSPGVVAGEIAIPGDPAVPTAVPGTGITAGEITGAITAALPITGSIAGDAVVGDTLAEPDSLGAVFVSKFPFCIPWDVVKAIQLLATPPVTPYWEVDFMQPIAGRVGGFQGSTTIVIDFGEYPIVGIATRWFSTLMFVYALASGTKKLIWTA